jgi:nudix-type nucleoside diphosphatase (YffH/AdpP family)
MKVEIYEKRRVFDGFFKIDEVKLRYERFNGTMAPVATRLCFERGDSVAAVILDTDNQEIILVNQFKYPSFEKGPGWITELIAGMIDEGETPEVAIRRELIEETGYRAAKLEYVSTFYVSPGGSSERIVLFYAEVDASDKVAKGGGLRSEGEDIKLVRFPIQEVGRILSTNEIMDAKTMIGLMWLSQRWTQSL